MSLAFAALCTALKQDVPDQTTALACSYAEMRRELHTLQREHVRRLGDAEDERTILRIRTMRLEDQIIDARDEAEETKSDMHRIQTRIKDALSAITRYRYTGDDKYLGWAMVLLDASLSPTEYDITEGDRVAIFRGETGVLKENTPSGMAIVTTDEDTMHVPMHILRRAV